MTDELYFGLALLPVILLSLYALVRHTDNSRPTDWVARRHRQIARNGFKSRMGVR
jgi:hypothetical protein